MDEHTVKIVRSKKLQLVFDIRNHPFRRIIRYSFTVESPVGGGVATEPPGDDNILAGDLLQCQAKFTHRIPVATSAIKVIDTNTHSVFNQCHCVLIRDKTEVVAKPLRPKWNNRDTQFCPAQATTRQR